MLHISSTSHFLGGTKEKKKKIFLTDWLLLLDFIE